MSKQGTFESVRLGMSQHLKSAAKTAGITTEQGKREETSVPAGKSDPEVAEILPGGNGVPAAPTPDLHDERGVVSGEKLPDQPTPSEKKLERKEVSPETKLAGLSTLADRLASNLKLAADQTRTELEKAGGLEHGTGVSNSLPVATIGDEGGIPPLPTGGKDMTLGNDVKNEGGAPQVTGTIGVTETAVPTGSAITTEQGTHEKGAELDINVLGTKVAEFSQRYQFGYELGRNVAANMKQAAQGGSTKIAANEELAIVGNTANALMDLALQSGVMTQKQASDLMALAGFSPSPIVLAIQDVQTKFAQLDATTLPLDVKLDYVKKCAGAEAGPDMDAAQASPAAAAVPPQDMQASIAQMIMELYKAVEAGQLTDEQALQILREQGLPVDDLLGLAGEGSNAAPEAGAAGGAAAAVEGAMGASPQGAAPGEGAAPTAGAPGNAAPEGSAAHEASETPKEEKSEEEKDEKGDDKGDKGEKKEAFAIPAGAILPGALALGGAAVGAGVGKKENRLRNALYGALAGVGVGVAGNSLMHAAGAGGQPPTLAQRNVNDGEAGLEMSNMSGRLPRTADLIEHATSLNPKQIAEMNPPQPGVPGLPSGAAEHPHLPGLPGGERYMGKGGSLQKTVLLGKIAGILGTLGNMAAGAVAAGGPLGTAAGAVSKGVGNIMSHIPAAPAGAGSMLQAAPGVVAPAAPAPITPIVKPPQAPGIMQAVKQNAVMSSALPKSAGEELPPEAAMGGAPEGAGAPVAAAGGAPDPAAGGAPAGGGMEGIPPELQQIIQEIAAAVQSGTISQEEATQIVDILDQQAQGGAEGAAPEGAGAPAAIGQPTP